MASRLLIAIGAAGCLLTGCSPKPKEASTGPRVGGVDARIGVLRQELKSKDWAVRLRAAQELGKLGRSATPAVYALLYVVSADDGNVSAAAAYAVVLIDPMHRDAVPALVLAIAEENASLCLKLKRNYPRPHLPPTPSVGAIAAKALVRRGLVSDEVFPALVMNHDHLNPEVRKTIREAFAKIDQRATPRLVKALVHKDGRVREAAFVKLRKLEPDRIELASVLMGILVNSDRYLRWGTMDFLKRMGPKAKSAGPLLLTMLHDRPESTTRRAILQAVAAIGPLDESCVPLLLVHLKRYTDGDCVRGAAEALTKIGKPALPALEKMLKSNKGFHRITAAKVIYDIGGKSKEKALKALIDCIGSFPTTNYAAQTLMSIGRPAVPAMLEALKGEDTFRKKMILYTLGRMGRNAVTAVPTLEKLAADKELKWAASEALTKIKAAQEKDNR